ncbi:MAG: phage baseplate assembly protein V [Solirubrobacteraceae bacterium]
MRAVATLPQVLVEVEGELLGDAVLRDLATVRVRQRLSAPAQCELAFHGPVETELPAPGVALRVAATGHDTPLFSGQVTVVEHVFGADRDHQALVRAYDPLHRLRKTRHARAITGSTVEELAGELAGRVGLAVDAAASGPLWQNLVQHRESDLELLVVLAERVGLYPVVRDGTLRLLTLEGDGEPLPLVLGEDLLEARVQLSGETVTRAVSAAGWDPLRAESHRATATAPRSGRDVAASVAPGDVGADDELLLVDESAPGDEHAAALAQAELDVRAAAEVTLWGVCEGDPRLQPGALVDAGGMRAELDGTYVLCDVTHTIDPVRGFVTELSSAPPPVRRRRSASTAALGEVTAVDDPEGRGRVRVRLPAYEDVESDWLGVVTAGAGDGRGLVALPDAGDAVLVLFPHEDPAAGIVVGGLYGAGGPPDPGVAGGAVKRFSLTTAGGQRITLDDDRSVLRVEDATGSSVELSPGAVTLHAATNLTIEAPGRALKIRATSVDFEQA